jgi:hypothetical protein
MDKDLEGDPRVLALTENLLDDMIERGLADCFRDAFRAIARNAVTGALYALWRHADTYLQTGDVTPVSVTGLASITGLSVTVLTRFPPEWLRERPDGTVELPGYSDKNMLVTKDLRKENNRLRQARFRAKQRNARNALPSRESNARNSPSRAGAHTRARAQPGPVPPYRDREAALASAPAHLAQPKKPEPERQPKPNGKHPPTPPKTPEQLASDARQLAATGLTTAEITRMLAQHGVTLEQTAAWLAPPSVKSAPAS